MTHPTSPHLNRFACLILAATFVATAGCASFRNNSPTTQVVPDGAASADPRVAQLRGAASDLDDAIAGLPADQLDEQRLRTAGALSAMERILPLLQGQQRSVQFAVELRTIARARAALANLKTNIPVEPAIDDALQATSNALTSISAEPFYNHANVSDALSRLRSTLHDLDFVRGPSHQSISADALRQIQSITHNLIDAFTRRSQQPTT